MFRITWQNVEVKSPYVNSEVFFLKKVKDLNWKGVWGCPVGPNRVLFLELAAGYAPYSICEKFIMLYTLNTYTFQNI